MTKLLWATVVTMLMLVYSPQVVVADEGYQPDPTINGVKLHGVIRLAEQPKMNIPIPVYRDTKYCGESVVEDDLVVDPSTKGLSGVIVSLVGVERGKALTEPDATLVLEIESQKCRFSPHLSAVVAGTKLEVRNNDPILHDLRIRKDTRFGPTYLNIIQPAGTRSVQKPLKETGHFDVRCDVHSFMWAHIRVFDHPYFAITDASGSFEMTEVPPGVYKLQIWHEHFGTREKTIKVPPGEAVHVDMDIGSRPPLSEAKPQQQ